MISHAIDTIARPSTRRMLSTASSALRPPALRINWPDNDVSAVAAANPMASRYSP
jgi:hypothetical protein